jgi:DNA-binding NarL/FixJ family response regulator
MRRRSAARRAHPLTERECLVLDRIGRDRTHKAIAAELGVSINTVANLAAKAYRKLGAHGAAAAVLAHRDAHPWCGTRIDFGPMLEHIVAARSA